MVKIPYIKIPSVRVGSIVPTSNIGAGGATPAPPTPITYLTQWQMMGNSVVHTDEYLTQWKVEGNSVVDNNAILSCGDLGPDGKYHVKISNGVTIYDIALTEPLRKVNDVADSIEFANGVATLTRAFGKVDWLNDTFQKTSSLGRIYFTISNNNIKTQTLNILSSLYITVSSIWANISDPASFPNLHINSHPSINTLRIIDEDKNDLTAVEFAQANANAGVEIIYELVTPTTETIQVSPFPISPTDTYTSANDTPYSAFEYKKNVEIWSCGEYSAVDGKYHILVQPLGGSVADIALDEPLRKVNNVADKIEFADGVATLTRCLYSFKVGNQNWARYVSGTSGCYRMATSDFNSISKHAPTYNVLTNVIGAIYPSKTGSDLMALRQGVVIAENGAIFIYDPEYNIDANTFKVARAAVEIIFELATPTTETIQVPQIAEAESYTCEISQGGKAVSWSSFETNSE